MTPVFRKLVKEKWWTDEEKDSSADGSVSGKGLLGDYRIVVRYQDKVKITEFTLNKDSKELVVKLDE